MLLYLESFGNPRKFARIARRVARAQADPRDEERHDARRRARRGLAHRGARRLGGGGRRALPPGRRDPRRRRSRSCSTSPRCSRAQPLPRGRRVARAHERGRARDPLRRRLRGRRARAADARRGDARARSPALLPREASVANPVDMLGSATAATLRGGVCRCSSPTRASTRVIVLFVPPVVVGADEVARGDRAARSQRPSPTKPVLAVDHERRGHARDAAERGAVAVVRLSRVGRARARPRGRARRLAAAARRARCRTLDGHRRAPPRRDRRRGARATRATPGSTPADARALLEAYGIPLVARARRRDADEAVAAAARARLPGRREDGRGRARTRPSAAASRSTSRDDEQVRAAVERIGAPVLVQPIVQRRRRAARRRRPGSGLRAARRLRARAASSPS